MKKTFITAAILAFAASAHADELTDIQTQAKQLREQNAAMTKRLADPEKRRKTLESQKPVAANNLADAMAADLPYKAAIKAKPAGDDGICVKGICVYGNFDIGLAYMTHSAQYNALAAGPLETLPQKNGAGLYFGVGDNQMSSSFIGLRGKQEIADNLYAVFNLQTLFNPGSGMNASGTGSLAQYNGLATNLTAQNSDADSSKGGQMFNGAEYFGISSPSLVVDWRFAKHMDMYAGAMWVQVQNGLAAGFLAANGLPNGTINPASTGSKASNIDPGVGLRYQF